MKGRNGGKDQEERHKSKNQAVTSKHKVCSLEPGLRLRPVGFLDHQDGSPGCEVNTAPTAQNCVVVLILG